MNVAPPPVTDQPVFQLAGTVDSPGVDSVLRAVKKAGYPWPARLAGTVDSPAIDSVLSAAKKAGYPVAPPDPSGRQPLSPL